MSSPVMWQAVSSYPEAVFLSSSVITQASTVATPWESTASALRTGWEGALMDPELGRLLESPPHSPSLSDVGELIISPDTSGMKANGAFRRERGPIASHTVGYLGDTVWPAHRRRFAPPTTGCSSTNLRGTFASPKTMADLLSSARIAATDAPSSSWRPPPDRR